MSNTQTAALVLKDSAGSYYLVPQELLEQVRVPVERTAELEQLIATAADGRADSEDVEGHVLPYAVVAAPFVAAGLMWGLHGISGALGGDLVSTALEYAQAQSQSRQ